MPCRSAGPRAALCLLAHGRYPAVGMGGAKAFSRPHALWSLILLTERTGTSFPCTSRTPRSKARPARACTSPPSALLPTDLALVLSFLASQATPLPHLVPAASGLLTAAPKPTSPLCSPVLPVSLRTEAK